MPLCKSGSTLGYVNSLGRRKSEEGSVYPAGRWEPSFGSRCTEGATQKTLPQAKRCLSLFLLSALRPDDLSVTGGAGVRAPHGHLESEPSSLGSIYHL